MAPLGGTAPSCIAITVPANAASDIVSISSGGMAAQLQAATLDGAIEARAVARTRPVAVRRRAFIDAVDARGASEVAPSRIGLSSVP
jgi:hypothetical protein